MKWSIPSKIIEQGRALVKENRVLKVVPDEENTVWRAEVLDDDTYTVILDGTAKEEDVCQCQVFQKKGYCEHTVAVELFLREMGMTRVHQFNEELKRYPEVDDEAELQVNEVLEGYLSHRQVTSPVKRLPRTSRVKVTLEIQFDEVRPYIISYEDIAYLRIRVGVNNLYYVTDMDNFFQAVVQDTLYILPNRDREEIWLSPSTLGQDTYDLLVELANAYSLRNKWLLLVMNTPENKKNTQRFYLMSEELNRLKDLYLADNRISIRFKLDGNAIKPTFSNDKALVFSLKKDNDLYQLTWDQSVNWLAQYGLLIQDETLYETTQDSNFYDDLRFLQGFFAENDYQITLPEEEMTYFISLFGRTLMAYSEIDQLDQVFELYREDLQVHVTLDVEGTDLYVTPEYQYGEFLVSDEAENQVLPDDNTILVRDFSGEVSVENTLKALGFVSEKGAFVQRFDNLTDVMTNIENFGRLFIDRWDIKYGKFLRNVYDNKVNATVKMTPSDGSRFLSVDFELSDVEPVEVDRILNAIMENEAYIRLRDGRIIDVQNTMDDEQKRMLQQISAANNEWQNGDVVPIFQTLRFQTLVDGNEVFEEFYDDIVRAKDKDYTPSSSLKATLSDYQETSVKWFRGLAKYQLGGLLADEMGLGKTVQTISFILDYIENNPHEKSLVLAPASVLYNWAHEFKRFTPSLNVAVVDGTIDEREAIRRDDTIDVWLTSYQSYRNDQEAYQKVNLDILVLDEAQAIKNDNTILYRSVKKQVAAMRIGLSGTPMENNLNEFWALMQIIVPGLLPNKHEFQKLSVGEIARIASPFVLRRTKNDVALQLPTKTVTDRFSMLDPEQKNIYLAYLKKIQDQLNNDSSEAGHMHMELLAGITRLRQICCHPRLVKNDYTGQSGKFEYFKVMLKRAIESGRKVLVFSQFTSMLDVMSEYLAEEGIDYYMMTGQTNKKVRQEQVDEFNTGDKSVFLISLRAGGVGINLTGADTIFLYDLWWNPAVEEQAIGRAHRIGQKKDVEVVRFITEGTIEQRIAELQEEKRYLFEQLFDDGDQAGSQSLSLDDLKFILGVSQAL